MSRERFPSSAPELDKRRSVLRERDRRASAFFSFPNTTVYPIAHWVPLYENTANYEDEANTEWITADGSIIWTWGCLTSCVTAVDHHFLCGERDDWRPL